MPFSSNKDFKKEFDKIYQEHYSTLYLHALTMLQDGDEAKDVVQDVFLKLWMNVENLSETYNLKAYLIKSTRNNILDRFAKDAVKRKYLLQLNQMDFVFIEDESEVERQLMKAVEEKIAVLPEQMRLVFQESKFNQKSNKEIAENLNISINTVKTHLSRAIKRLKIKSINFFSFFL